MNTNTGLRDIYHVRANCQKSQFFGVFSHFFKVPTIDRKAHAFKRRVDAVALNSAAIHELEESILKNVNKFCGLMVDTAFASQNQWSPDRNMSELTGYLMTDIKGDITFHRSWNMLQSTKNRALLKTLSEGVEGLNMMGHMQGLLDWNIDKIFFPSSTEGTYQYKQLSEEQSTGRLKHSSEINDLFGKLMAARDPETGKGFTEEELVAEAGLLIIAGSQTSATAITSTIFYLLTYPVAMRKFTADVLAAFKSLNSIRAGKKLQACAYLRACLDESMRLSPGVGGILPREVLAGGMEVDGRSFPPGTDIGVANYAIHHNETYFPRPYAFYPERWLLRSSDPDGIEPEQLALARSANAPFSVGHTSCVGKNLAYQEVSITLARLFWLYEARIEPGGTLGEDTEEAEFQTFDRSDGTVQAKEIVIWGTVVVVRYGLLL